MPKLITFYQLNRAHVVLVGYYFVGVANPSHAPIGGLEEAKLLARRVSDMWPCCVCLQDTHDRGSKGIALQSHCRLVATRTRTE